MLKENMHVAVPTSFNEDESLNIQNTINHIKMLHKNGIKSVLVSGSTGEQHSMSILEKFELIDALDQEDTLMNEMEIIFGVSSIRQTYAEVLADYIKNTRIAAILIGFPPYIIPSQEEAYIYTEKIINSAQKPAILYNNPNRTGFDLSLETIIKLLNNELVIGIKDPGDKEKVAGILEHTKENPFYIYAGGEEGLEEKINEGYNRLSSIAGNIYPKEIKIWLNHLIARTEINEEERQKIDEIRNEIYVGSAILNIKRIANKSVTPLGHCRRPLGN